MTAQPKPLCRSYHWNDTTPPESFYVHLLTGQQSFTLDFPNKRSTDIDVIVESLNDEGKQCLKDEEFYQAMWKYFYSEQILLKLAEFNKTQPDYESDKLYRACVNIAYAAVKLLEKTPSDIHLFRFAARNCEKVIESSKDPSAPVPPTHFVQQAYYRLGECFQIHSACERIKPKSIKHKLRTDALESYIKCHQLQSSCNASEDMMALAKAVTATVDWGRRTEHWSLLNREIQVVYSSQSRAYRLIERMLICDFVKLKHLDSLFKQNEPCLKLSKEQSVYLLEALFKKCSTDTPIEMIISLIGQLQKCFKDDDIPTEVYRRTKSNYVKDTLCDFFVQECASGSKLAKVSECFNPVHRTRLFLAKIDQHEFKQALTVLEHGDIIPEKINLSDFIVDLVDNHTLLKKLLMIKVSPKSSKKHQKSPITMLLAAWKKSKGSRTHAEIVSTIVLLLNHGGDVEDLCNYKQGSRTTPIHVATELSLASGNAELLTTVVSKCRSPDHFDQDNRTPLHILCTAVPKSQNEAVLHTMFELLLPIYGMKDKDTDGKTALDYLQKNDLRHLVLRKLMPEISQRSHTQDQLTTTTTDALPSIIGEPKDKDNTDNLKVVESKVMMQQKVSFVRSMLQRQNVHKSYPITVWHSEYEIISMKPGEGSILLLGRSGTGKTTCCLYRMWNEFQLYWCANNFEPMIPHVPLIDSQDHLESASNGSGTSTTQFDQIAIVSNETFDSQQDTSLDSCHTSKSSSEYEHLHQIYITKNYIQCDQMKKQFYGLAAGSDVAGPFKPFEDKPLLVSISTINDHAYPLFLTAREFFLLLDNSLGDGDNFFRRDESGQLLHTIISSDYAHEDPETLLDLVNDSDADESEDDSDDEDTREPQKKGQHVLQGKKKRVEVTSSYFAEKIWPDISPSDTKIDPLLVWTEIKSFIKGSLKAVESKNGYLSQQEYKNLGCKLASTFAEDRSFIYQLFEKYQIKRTQIFEDLFEESELVHNIFCRLNKLPDLPWSIHSIYIDEVQDFTQAELSVLLRCCRDPNNLFLTGDNAQSIMREISFRFSEVRSLFHETSTCAKKSKKAPKITVPKIHQLGINFRFHSGILNLASSVTDLMEEFFSDSFEHLPHDKGIFEGPLPLLIRSTDTEGLALMEMGNRKGSSAVEFGANQAIIVRSADAKKTLPDYLRAGIVLTVYEAKGLEFNDVLLFNFFKDSNVSKGWHVVTDYLRRSFKLTKTCTNDSTSAEFKKPSPLKFSEEKHMSLMAELKHLYTAITRAKGNLWIYDADESKRLPMFDYWHERGLVKVV